MAKKLTKAQLSTQLIAIVAAGANGMNTPADVHGPLVADGMVEINPAVTDANGHVATRATAKGIEAVNAGAANGSAAAATATKPTFTLQKAALPAVSGRGRSAGSSLYPFEQMEVGDSFFVPNTDDKPDAAASLGGTVAGASKRYAKPTGEKKTTAKGNTIDVLEYERKFTVRSRTAEQESNEGLGNVAGARVYRVK